jgi:hypothetical protein
MLLPVFKVMGLNFSTTPQKEFANLANVALKVF